MISTHYTKKLLPDVLKDVVDSLCPFQPVVHQNGVSGSETFPTEGRLKTAFFSPHRNRILSINFDAAWRGELQASNTMLRSGQECEIVLRAASRDAATRIAKLNERYGWSSILRDVCAHGSNKDGLHATLIWRVTDWHYVNAALLLNAMREAAALAVVQAYQ